MADEKIRELSINQSMTKPLLILGCDRSLFMASALFCGYVSFSLGFTRGNISVTVLGVSLWLIIHFGLRLLGKADPLMFDVFKRSALYSDRPFHTQFFYPAHSSINASIPKMVRERWL